MPPARAAPLRQHPRAEHGVGAALGERGDEILDDLGRVLTVAVEQHDDVEAVVDRPAVAALLVPAVAEVAWLAHDRQRQVGRFLVGEADLVGGVGAGVIAHEDLFDARPKARRQPVEHRGQRVLARCTRRRGRPREDWPPRETIVTWSSSVVPHVSSPPLQSWRRLPAVNRGRLRGVSCAARGGARSGDRGADGLDRGPDEPQLHRSHRVRSGCATRLII